MVTTKTTFLLLGLVLPFAACVGPSYAERGNPVPPAAPQKVRVERGSDLPPPNEAATEAWLTEQIEKAPRVEEPERPELPPLRDPFDGPDSRNHYDEFGYEADYGPYRDHYYRPVYGRTGYYDPYGYYGRPYRRSTFPINTAIGAGVGAIIGHQRGRRGRGALIGGGIGLLFDTLR